MDDSIVRVIAGRECVIRRARGYAPLPVTIGGGMTGGEMARGGMTARPRHYLAVGAHLKNAIAVASGDAVYLSQHIGDLETEESFRAFRDTVASFRGLYDIPGGTVACDMHPGYLPTQYARGEGLPLVRVQHHHAHVCSCMAEHGLTGTVLGVSWDGTGYGPDGTIWGGEFLLTDGAEFRRTATFREFPLPGGEKAIREPGRSAVGMLWTLFGDEVFRRNDLAPVRALTDTERGVLRRMLHGRINTPMTTSAGRIFDAVSALLGVRMRSAYEGQAAMELEFLADRGAPGGKATGADEGLYPFGIEDMSRRRDAAASPAGDPGDGGSYAPSMVIDWGPILEAIVRDIARCVAPPEISRKFHNTLAEVIVEIARRTGHDRVILTGGCFQNRRLTERAVGRLSSAGFRPYWHRDVPTNDGGIALGQVYCAMAREAARESRRKEEARVPGNPR